MLAKNRSPLVEVQFSQVSNEMMSDRRTKRDLHGLDENGMVICNPRDREAAHRAEVEGIATDKVDEVTCRKCLQRMSVEQRRAARRG